MIAPGKGGEMIAAAEHSVGHTCSRGLAALAVLCAISGPARATGLSDLEEGLPLEVRDAFAIGLYGSELQLQGGYERTRKDENRYILFPRLELGIVPNGQILVGAPFFLGGADDAGSGNVTAEAFYNFNMEGLVVPAVAVAAVSTAGTHAGARAPAAACLGGRDGVEFRAALV